MPKVIRVVIFAVVPFLSLAYLNPLFADAEPEKLTITTYYPIPSGTYNKLTTTGDTYLAISGGNVGIGTTAPQGLLQVGASPSAGVINGLVVTSAGMVGIGTTASASERLYVKGIVKINGNIAAASGNPQYGYTGTLKVYGWYAGNPQNCDIVLKYGIITASTTCPNY